MFFFADVKAGFFFEKPKLKFIENVVKAEVLTENNPFFV